MKNFTQRWKGIKIRSFNSVMILLSCALYVFLLIATTYTAQHYEQLVQLTNDHIRLEKAAGTILRASDYLTEQVRMYTQTGDAEYAQLYIEEVTVTRSRENALELMRQHSTYPDEEAELAKAVEESNTLMIREFYAIALMAAAEGHSEIVGLPILADTALETSDAELSQQGKITKAREIVFDVDYQMRKEHIYGHLDTFTQSILNTTKAQVGNGQSQLYDSIRIQRRLLSILMFLNAVTFLVITLLVIKPLRENIKSVRNRELFREQGAYEFRYLAQTYNEVYQKNDALAASEAILFTQTQQDEITGLFNRSAFYEIAREWIQTSDEEMYIVTMHIVNFKIVNEHYGMTTGDRLLRKIGKQLRALDKNESMLISRFLSDHFYMCIPKSEFEQIKLPRSFQTFLEDIDIRVIYGVFLAEDRNLPIHVMCDRALEAAHDKTANYTDYIRFYNDKTHQQTLLEREIEAEMERALAERQFYVVVQPKYDPASEEIVGGEALVRWHDPQKGVVSPCVFINIFERNGFIVPLDHFVWEETCRLQAQMKRKGIKTVPISINVSRIHFYNRELRSKFRELIQKYHLEPLDIELEITESICGSDAENIFDTIRELQSDGFKIAMDDFGSGQSSLNMLKEMPLDILKMDLRFLGGEENKSHVILKSLIEMAHTMDLNVVVEGVELSSQVEFLRQFERCHLQGYYYSRPVETDVFEAMLKQQ